MTILHHRGLRRPLLVALVVSLAGACMQAQRPGDVGADAVLGPRGELAGAGDEGPFRVVFAAPRGAASDTSAIHVVFSRSLRTLGAEGQPPPRIELSPQLPGHWMWIGGRALGFELDEGATLPGATAFRVVVPAATRALDGATLGAPYAFDFETPRPSVARHAPDGEGALPSASLELFMTQAVEPAVLERSLELVALGHGRELALKYRVERPEPSLPKRLRVVFDHALPLDSTIRATVKKGLRGTEGSLPTLEDQSVAFKTYGPLRVSDAVCNADRAHACRPGSSPSLTFSNDVTWRALKAALSVSPPLPLRFESWQEDAETTRWLSIPASFPAGKSVTVRLAADLRDRFGQALGQPYARTFRYGDYDPLLAVGLEGENLEPASKLVVPVGSVNLSRYDIVRAGVGPAEVLRLIEAGQKQRGLSTLLALPGVRREPVSLTVERNGVMARDIELGDLLPGGRGAFALAALSPDPRVGQREPSLAKVSDLGITAKLGDEGSVVWVTRLSSTAPVPNADVEIWRSGNRVARYKTDTDGIARVPGGELTLLRDRYDYRESAIVVARSGSDWTFESIANHLPAWRLPVSTDLSAKARRYGMIFTERGVYRPGDNVSVKGIVREEARTGNAIPAQAPFEVALRSPNGDVLETRRVTTSRYGTFALQYRVPPSGGLGNYEVTAGAPAHDPGDGPELSGSFEVAEYRPAEFEVGVRPRAATYVSGERARFELAGDYLYGAPMAGAKVRYVFSRSETQYPVPGLEDFATDADELYADEPYSPLAAGELGHGEGELDATGRLVVERDLSLPEQRGPVSVLASVEVTDASQQTIGGSASVLVHPARFYLGLERPKDWFFDAPGAFEARVLAAKPDGTRLSGQRVELELVSRRWTLAREAVQGENAHAVSRPVDNVVSRCSVVTAAEPKGCRLAAPRGGYYLVVARATDDKRRRITAALGVYGIGGGAASWADGDRATLELVPNRRKYAVGDRARILVKSPFPEAEALVTIERRGVYRAERHRLVGPTPTLEIPITADLRPNAYVAVQLLRARHGSRPEARVGPSYRVGYANLVVAPELRRLEVAVKPSASQTTPGAELSVNLAVTDAGGKALPAELTVFAVDEGVLSLTGYRTPDPLPIFTASRPLGVTTLETRDALAKLGLGGLEGMLGIDKGGDGGGGGELGARSDFRQTAFFEPSVVTDAKGHAHVHFKLPENLTTYRVMATAVSDDNRYGYGAARVTASKRLMARPALPRFVRAGDRIEAGVVVASKGFDPHRVRVSVEARGLVLEGASSRDVELRADQAREVTFTFRAERVGKASLAFQVSGGGEKDAVRVERNVLVPAALETVAVYGSVNDRAEERLGALSSVRDNVGGLNVSLASSVLSGLSFELSNLFDYPYACTEQLASRLLSLVPLGNLARALGKARPTGEAQLVEPERRRNPGPAAPRRGLRDVAGRGRELALGHALRALGAFRVRAPRRARPQGAARTSPRVRARRPRAPRRAGSRDGRVLARRARDARRAGRGLHEPAPRTRARAARLRARATLALARRRQAAGRKRPARERRIGDRARGEHGARSGESRQSLRRAHGFTRAHPGHRAPGHPRDAPRARARYAAHAGSARRARRDGLPLDAGGRVRARGARCVPAGARGGDAALRRDRPVRRPAPRVARGAGPRRARRERLGVPRRAAREPRADAPVREARHGHAELRGAPQLRSARPPRGAAGPGIFREQGATSCAARSARDARKERAPARRCRLRALGPRRHRPLGRRAPGARVRRHRRSVARGPRGHRSVARHERRGLARVKRPHSVHRLRRGRRRRNRAPARLPCGAVPHGASRRSHAVLRQPHAAGRLPLPPSCTGHDGRALRRAAHARFGDVRARGVWAYGRGRRGGALMRATRWVFGRVVPGGAALGTGLRRAAVVGLAVLLSLALALVVAVARKPLPAALSARGDVSLRITDRGGRLLYEARTRDGRLAGRVRLSELSPWVVPALVAAEDRRFYAHPGVNPLSMLRAFAQLVAERRLVSGASTLTQQLARAVEPHPRNALGKLSEIVTALRIERELDKRAIVEEYLGRVEFGPGVLGIEAASRRYFDKPSSALDLSEAATLVALPRGPTYYDPSRRPARLDERRRRILGKMRDFGLADARAVERALLLPITLSPAERGLGPSQIVLSVARAARGELSAQGPVERIETTLDRGLQEEAVALARRAVNRASDHAVGAAAVLVVNNASSDVLAYVGSPDFFDSEALGQNDGVRALRQAGSTLKPFLYALALERRTITAASLLPDLPLALATDKGTFSPENYDRRAHGPVRAREALASSFNLPAVALTNRLGVERSLDALRRMGFSSLVRPAADYGAALALGDGEIRLVELARAYAMLARGGVLVPERVVTATVGPGGLRRALPRSEGERVLDARVAAIVTDVLSDPLRPGAGLWARKRARAAVSRGCQDGNLQGLS